jgi:hypothetical protein
VNLIEGSEAFSGDALGFRPVPRHTRSLDAYLGHRQLNNARRYTQMRHAVRQFLVRLLERARAGRECCMMSPRG